MAAFFQSADPETAAWALYFLAGRRPKKLISSKKLRAWAEELAGIPAWLGEECYSAVGDTAEMIALVLAPVRRQHPQVTSAIPALSLAQWMLNRLELLKNANEVEQKAKIQEWWMQLGTREIFVLNKMMSGSLRIGVSETLVYRALSQTFHVSKTAVAARLLGNWTPSADFFKQVTQLENSEKNNPAEQESALPVPFCLAAPMEGPVEDLGSIDEWQIEWKWDGIRGQIVKIDREVEIWSRGEERITEAFPDLVAAFQLIMGNFTLDGEILAGTRSQINTFNDLQKRLNRKKPSVPFLRENPVMFLAYDLLREDTELLVAQPLSLRRSRLEKWISQNGSECIGISSLVEAKDWDTAKILKSESRSRRTESLMVKRRDSLYHTGRKRGIWFKWKVDPLTLDVVLTSAQPGTGRRASLYTDYTFGIWKGDLLVPIAKAYSGLTDQEIQELDRWIRRNTLEKFGPVRMVKAERVFEIGFEGIAKSARHKAGFAVRFPRILRERLDKPATEADRVESVQALFESLTQSPSE